MLNAALFPLLTCPAVHVPLPANSSSRLLFSVFVVPPRLSVPPDSTRSVPDPVKVPPVHANSPSTEIVPSPVIVPPWSTSTPVPPPRKLPALVTVSVGPLIRNVCVPAAPTCNWATVAF